MPRKLTTGLEEDIRLYLPVDFYNKIFKESSQAQRNQADWYLITLAVKAIKNRSDISLTDAKEQAALHCHIFLKDVMIFYCSECGNNLTFRERVQNIDSCVGCYIETKKNKLKK